MTLARLESAPEFPFVRALSCSRRAVGFFCLAAVVAISVGGCGRRGPRPGTVKDEAMRAGLTAKEMDYPLPAGGRGYIRPASLISLWSTAPFLQNNTAGPFEWSPSVEARMRSFEKSIEEML